MIYAKIETPPNKIPFRSALLALCLICKTAGVVIIIAIAHIVT